MKKLVHVTMDADPDECDVGAGEEGDEGAWDGGRVEDLDDEAELCLVPVLNVAGFQCGDFVWMMKEVEKKKVRKKRE